MANLTSLIVNDTGFLKLPSGTVDQRPSATAGRLRYNTSKGELEINTGTKWKSAQIAEPSIVTNGLVLHLDAGNVSSYPGTGTTWSDLSSNGNNGTLTNGPTYNSGNGGSIVFDGVDDYVNLNSASLLPVGISDRTIVAFVKTPTSFPTSYLHVIHWGTAGTSQAFGMAIFSNGGLNTHPWSGAPSQGTVITGTDYCLAVSYTHSGFLHKFWINGISQGSGIAREINTGTTDARIGTRISTTTEYWGPTGKIYNVQVYNRALSATEIQQNFNALRGRFGI